MNAAAKLFSTLFVTGALALACGADQPPEPTKVSASPAGEAAASTDSALPQAGTPRIAADEPVHDFGAIKATEAAEHVFKIRNAGDADLKIERVQRT